LQQTIYEALKETFRECKPDRKAEYQSRILSPPQALPCNQELSAPSLLLDKQTDQELDGHRDSLQQLDFKCLDSAASSSTGPASKKRRSGRAKERTIQEVIQKVEEWRGLSEGSLLIDKESGELVPWTRGRKKVRFSREEAAVVVGISKKSLDDYLLFLRHGKRFNFDFEKHKNSLMGVLRKFVNEARKVEKRRGVIRKREMVKQSFSSEFKQVVSSLD
jgi:hypothetical protein